jgi:acid phosphatase family membrane protein YuiD
MSWFSELLNNPFLLCPLGSWFAAQVLKVIINAILTKKLDWERLIGDGGMPSAHSATVSSLCVFSLLHFGPDTFQFAVTLFLAIIVCHDAMGVRLETSKQAMLLNEMKKLYETLSSQELPEVKLKEFVGHTPIQVIAGILTGIAVACCMHFLIL